MFNTKLFFVFLILTLIKIYNTKCSILKSSDKNSVNIQSSNRNSIITNHENVNGCVVPFTSKKDWNIFWPLIFHSNGSLYETKTLHNNEVVVLVSIGEEVLISCSPNYIKEQPPTEYLKAKCQNNGKFLLLTNTTTDKKNLNNNYNILHDDDDDDDDDDSDENNTNGDNLLKNIRDLRCDLRAIEEVLESVPDCPTSSTTSVHFGYVNPINELSYIIGEACYNTRKGQTYFAHVRLLSSSSSPTITTSTSTKEEIDATKTSTIVKNDLKSSSYPSKTESPLPPLTPPSSFNLKSKSSTLISSMQHPTSNNNNAFALSIKPKSFLKNLAHPQTGYKQKFMKAFQLDEFNDRLRNILNVENIPWFEMQNYIDENLLGNQQFYAATKKLSWNYLILHENLVNLKLLKEDISRLNGVDVYIGSHGVTTLRDATGNNVPVYLNDKKFPVPEIVWIIVKMNDKATAFAVFNNPILTVNDIEYNNKYCSSLSKCEEITWLKHTKSKDVRLNGKHGGIICCNYNEFKKFVEEVPNFDNIVDLYK